LYFRIQLQELHFSVLFQGTDFLGGIADKAGLNLVNNPAGIALAMAFVSLPFLINSARDGFAAVPETS